MLCHTDLVTLQNTAEGGVDRGGSKGDAFTLDDVRLSLFSLSNFVPRHSFKSVFPLKLRSIFKLHRGVACQTHDLLGCDCLSDDPQGSGSEEANGEHASPPDSDYDSDDDGEPVKARKGFTQASEYQRKDSPPVNVSLNHPSSSNRRHANDQSF